MKGGHTPTLLVGVKLAVPQAPRAPHPVDNASVGGSPYKYWNEDTLSRWLGLENLGWAILDGVRIRMFVDNGTRVNSVTPGYIHQHKLGCAQSQSWTTPSILSRIAFH